MTRTLHSSILLLLAILACALPAGRAQAAYHENVAQATIEQDGGHAFDLAWDVDRRGGGVVDDVNRARAAARCTDCKATAIAFQIVLVSGAQSSAGPTNEAVALNLECTRCEVVAEARQFVRVFDAPVRFTRAGRIELRDVRARLAALEAQDPPIDQLHQAIEQQESRVNEVLANELVLRSNPSESADATDVQLAQDADLG